MTFRSLFPLHQQSRRVAATAVLGFALLGMVPLASGQTANPGARTADRAQDARDAREAREEARADGLPGGLRLGARVQVDHGRFDGVHTRTGTGASATYLRRGEVSIGARLAREWRLSTVIAAEDEGVEIDTAALSWRPHDGLRLSVGRLDPDFGLDNTNSSSWTAGIERSALWDLAPGIADAQGGFGLRVDGHGARWHASAGLYDKSGPTAAVGRAVWKLVPSEGRVLQVGASLAQSRKLDTDGRLASRLGVRGVSEVDAGRRSDLAPALRRPARYDADSVVALELAAQRGPWLMQAEWLQRRLDGASGAPARSVSGTSLQLAWSPSGVARRYDEASARFGRPQGDARAAGRWELFYRVDTLDGVDALQAQVHTVGASWFLGERWRVSGNAVSARSDDPNAVGDDRGLGLVLRAQAVF